MEREMNSKFMAHVFKLRTCESPEEDVLIYLWELIRLSVLVNQLNFLSVIYMMLNVYILSISANSYQPPKFQSTWLATAHLYHQDKQRGPSSAIPVLSWWEDTHIFQKIRLTVFSVLLHFISSCGNQALMYLNQLRCDPPPSRTQYFK